MAASTKYDQTASCILSDLEAEINATITLMHMSQTDSPSQPPRTEIADEADAIIGMIKLRTHMHNELELAQQHTSDSQQ